jgi:hypothetical protein
MDRIEIPAPEQTQSNRPTIGSRCKMELQAGFLSTGLCDPACGLLD